MLEVKNNTRELKLQ